MTKITDFPLKELVDKKIYAKNDVKLWRLAYDDQKPVFVAKKGALVGTVDAWVSPRSGRSHTYLSFFDANKVLYYAKLNDDLSTTQIVAQGAKTYSQTTKEKEDEDKSFMDQLFDSFGKFNENVGKNLKMLAWLGLGVVIFREVNRNDRLKKK